MRLFVVHPGWVISTWDFDDHWVSAWRLMDLYGVNPMECVVDGDAGVAPNRGVPARPGLLGYDRDHLEAMMHLRPLTGVDYRPVSENERAMVRERLLALDGA